MNTPITLLATLCLCGAGLLAAPAAAAAHDDAMAMPVPAAPTAAPAAPKLQAALRALWHGHVEHTRDYALAVHARQPAKAKAAADAVVANARQLAGAVAGFYGKPAGAQMFTLLAGHWGGVKALTDAGFASDTAAADKAMADLNHNADAIAAFLSGANPYLPDHAVRGLLAMHIADHAQQIREIMAGDTKNEAATWTHMQAHMDTIADAMASALARQFPAKAH
jgi:hypothetical protein